MNRQAKVVIVAHQSRPGSGITYRWRGTPNEPRKLLGVEVTYIDDIHGERAKKASSA